MTTRICTALILLFGVALSSTTYAKTMQQWAEEYGIRMDASYDATRIMETKDGKLSFKERKAPQKSAMEISMGGMGGTMIMREDLNKAFFVMTDMGMYREMALGEAMSQSADGMQVSKVEELGRETVNGYSARKFKTQFKDKDGKGAGFMWITDDGVPIKMDMIYKNRGMKGQRMKMELVDLQMRNQDPSHFELPDGIQPMNFAAMMGMAQQMEQATGNSTGNRAPAAPSQPISQQPQQPTFADEISEAAQEESENAVIEETRGAIREGIRGLFKRARN